MSRRWQQERSSMSKNSEDISKNKNHFSKTRSYLKACLKSQRDRRGCSVEVRRGTGGEEAFEWGLWVDWQRWSGEGGWDKNRRHVLFTECHGMRQWGDWKLSVILCDGLVTRFAPWTRKIDAPTTRVLSADGLANERGGRGGAARAAWSSGTWSSGTTIFGSVGRVLQFACCGLNGNRLSRYIYSKKLNFKKPENILKNNVLTGRWTATRGRVGGVPRLDEQARHDSGRMFGVENRAKVVLEVYQKLRIYRGYHFYSTPLPRHPSPTFTWYANLPPAAALSQ